MTRYRDDLTAAHERVRELEQELQALRREQQNQEKTCELLKRENQRLSHDNATISIASVMKSNQNHAVSPAKPSKVLNTKPKRRSMMLGAIVAFFFALFFSVTHKSGSDRK